MRHGSYNSEGARAAVETVVEDLILSVEERLWDQDKTKLVSASRWDSNSRYSRWPGGRVVGHCGAFKLRCGCDLLDEVVRLHYY